MTSWWRASSAPNAACCARARRPQPPRRRAPGAEAPNGVFVEEIAGGIATWVADDSPLNKVAGLGFEPGALDAAGFERALARVEGAFHARGCPVQVELATLADPAVGQLLTARGYRLEGFENVLGRPLAAHAHSTPAPPAPPGPPGPPGIQVTEDSDEDLSTWLDVVVTGFANPDTRGLPSHESFPREALERDIATLARTPGFRRFTASRDGHPAGAASMRLAEGVAQLCGAATLPADRRRGVQSALLTHRLGLAAECGCDVATVTTQPGSKSQQNTQRKGFERLYTRAVLVRAPLS